MKKFEQKFKDKSGLKWDDRGEEPKASKYAYVERSYNPDSDEEDDTAAGADDGNDQKESVKQADCTLDSPTQELMKLIFNQVKPIYTTKPFAKTSKLTQDRATSTKPWPISNTTPTSCLSASLARGLLPVRNLYVQAACETYTNFVHQR
jgi:hypothetical protein